MTYKMARSECAFFFNLSFLVGQGVLMSGGHPRSLTWRFALNFNSIYLRVFEYHKILGLHIRDIQNVGMVAEELNRFDFAGIKRTGSHFI